MLTLIKNRTMKTYGKMETYLHPIPKLKLHEMSSDHFTPDKIAPRKHAIEGWVVRDGTRG